MARRLPSTTTGRLEAFSDGVIAIAITLLVLEISVPHADAGDLGDALLDQWPSYAAFGLSFVVIGIMWVSHHSMFERIAAVDRRLLFLNLLLLLGIGFLPFPTALLAEYVREGGEQLAPRRRDLQREHGLVGVAFWMMWRHLYQRPHLLVAGIDREMARGAMHRSLVGPIVYTLTIGLAFISAGRVLRRVRRSSRCTSRPGRRRRSRRPTTRPMTPLATRSRSDGREQGGVMSFLQIEKPRDHVTLVTLNRPGAHERDGVRRHDPAPRHAARREHRQRLSRRRAHRRRARVLLRRRPRRHAGWCRTSTGCSARASPDGR